MMNTMDVVEKLLNSLAV